LQSWAVNGTGLAHVNANVYKCSSISIDSH
jgi:hypothetical protein